MDRVLKHLLGKSVEVQQLIGRFKVIYRFLPQLVDKTRPMIRLLKKSTKFVWDDQCQVKFEQLKQVLIISLVYHPKCNGRVEVVNKIILAELKKILDST